MLLPWPVLASYEDLILRSTPATRSVVSSCLSFPTTGSSDSFRFFGGKSTLSSIGEYVNFLLSFCTAGLLNATRGSTKLPNNTSMPCTDGVKLVPSTIGGFNFSPAEDCDVGDRGIFGIGDCGVVWAPQRAWERRAHACFKRLFHRFLIAPSVLPGSRFAISAHRLPSASCASMIIWSSSSDQRSFLMLGPTWLCHLSRHCLPFLPGR